MAIRDPKELGKALKEEKDTIEIEGDLKNKVIKIKGTGKIAWGIAIAAIAISVAAILASLPSGGTSNAVHFVTAPVAVGILGASATTAAISIAVAAGGIGALKKLRDYKITEQSANRLVLKRK